MKMDGAKHNTDTLEFVVDKLVNRRTICTEASLKGGVERIVMRILVKVGCDFAENAKCRKSKVSLAIYVSQGLVSTLVVP